MFLWCLDGELHRLHIRKINGIRQQMRCCFKEEGDLIWLLYLYVSCSSVTSCGAQMTLLHQICVPIVNVVFSGALRSQSITNICDNEMCVMARLTSSSHLSNIHRSQTNKKRLENANRVGAYCLLQSATRGRSIDWFGYSLDVKREPEIYTTDAVGQEHTVSKESRLRQTKWFPRELIDDQIKTRKNREKQQQYNPITAPILQD